MNFLLVYTTESMIKQQRSCLDAKKKCWNLQAIKKQINQMNRGRRRTGKGKSLWVAKRWGIGLSQNKKRVWYCLVVWLRLVYLLPNKSLRYNALVSRDSSPSGNFCLLVHMTWFGVMDDGCNEWDHWSLFLVACRLILPWLEIYFMEKVWFRIWVPIGKLHVSS